MAKKTDEARELVRQVVEEGLQEGQEAYTVTKEEQEITILGQKDGTTRFDIPGLQKSYVLRAGRLYEQRHLDEDQEEALAEEAPVEPKMMEQLNYKGEVEEVDTNIFKNKIVCTCGNVRWVKNADFFQVDKCKPCTRRERFKRRTERAKAKRQAKRAKAA
jgi:hypothetical protein